MMVQSVKNGFGAFIRHGLAAVGVAGLCVLNVPTAWAQGGVNIQTEPFNPTAPAAPAGMAPAAEQIMDYREAMRQMVQSISTYARGLNPNFVILAESALPLTGKINPDDDTQVFPARTFMRAIDGVLTRDLLAQINPKPGEDPKKVEPAVLQHRARTAQDATTARRFGLKIFDLSFAEKTADKDAKYRASAKAGNVPFVADTPVLGTIPKFPKPTSPFQANPKSVADPAQVQNFIYVQNSQGFGLARDFVQALRDSNHDMVIVNVFHGNEPLNKQDVELLKYKKLGSKRLVLAELDISSAASYMYYWQPGWQVGAPAFISVPYIENPDSYRTLYWDPTWQAVLFGDVNSYLYGIMDLGFDGVVLKGVDAWRWFESGGEEG